MKRLLVMLLVVCFLAGCAGTLEKGCKELTKISNDINAYIPNAEQLVEEGKMSESDFAEGLDKVGIINKAAASACALKEVWGD